MKKTIIISLLLISFLKNYAQEHNVILIIADDLGLDYCSYYENNANVAYTPNVLRLLNRGVRFTKAWSNPLCSPTRAGILTGRYGFRTGILDVVQGTNPQVNLTEKTIPNLLNTFNSNGISKANIGKWHLSSPTPISNYNNPILLGYDHYEGAFSGTLPSFMSWPKITSGIATATTCTNYATTENVDNSIAWLSNQPTNKPFFLWLAFNAPHNPYHLPPANLHTNTTLSGTAVDITANPKNYFKVIVEAMDHEMGRLFDYLQANGKWENTEIIFIGDNGDDPLVAQNSGGAKGSLYQEGVSVPFIISGPTVVNPNRVSNALVNTADIFATVLEMFGNSNWQAQIPANITVDSKSIMPILLNVATTIRPWAFTEIKRIPAVAGNGKTMRNLQYKLIKFDNGTENFYNLSNDNTEDNDLLLGTLSTIDLTNYNYLCNEMTNLVGVGNFCNPALKTTENQLNLNVVFPNPFSSKINIENATGNENYTLTNEIGQEIFSGKNIEKQDFSALHKGIYFLKISDKTSIVTKLIKQ